MTQEDIKLAGITSLELRLAVVDYSTIQALSAEALAIRAEIKRRRGR